MLILHSRRNTTYQCTEITDIIHGVFNSGCSLFMWSGVHGLDECPVIHLLGTCARVLSIWTRLVPMWVRFVKFARNYFKMHTLSVRSRCIYLNTGVHSKRLVMDIAQCQFSSKLVKFVPQKTLMQGISVPKSWAEHLKLLVAIIGAVQVPSSLSAYPMPTSTTYAAPKDCLMFASKSPLAYLSVCYCLSWSAVAALFRHFLKLTCELQMCQNNINIYM